MHVLNGNTSIDDIMASYTTTSMNVLTEPLTFADSPSQTERIIEFLPEPELYLDKGKSKDSSNSDSSEDSFLESILCRNLNVRPRLWDKMLQKKQILFRFTARIGRFAFNSSSKRFNALY